jgi:hypothetical protein
MVHQFCNELVVVQVQFRLLDAKWTTDMLSMENCHEIREPGDGRLLFAGLRVRMGIFWAEPGSIVALVNKETSWFDVRGPGMDAAVAVSDAAYGGQTVLTEEVYCQVCSTPRMHLLCVVAQDETNAFEMLTGGITGVVASRLHTRSLQLGFLSFGTLVLT